jgi:hypothetical protein
MISCRRCFKRPGARVLPPLILYTFSFTMCRLVLEQQAGEEAFTCINKVEPVYTAPLFPVISSPNLVTSTRLSYCLISILPASETHSSWAATYQALVLHWHSRQTLEHAEKALILKWFKIQLVTSKWRRLERHMNAAGLGLSGAPGISNDFHQPSHNP